MKRAVSPLRRRKSLSREWNLLQHDDFAWLAQVHKALSPYWSARSGYAGW